jgi:hypothetical protein
LEAGEVEEIGWDGDVASASGRRKHRDVLATALGCAVVGLLAVAGLTLIPQPPSLVFDPCLEDPISTACAASVDWIGPGAASRKVFDETRGLYLHDLPWRDRKVPERITDLWLVAPGDGRLTDAEREFVRRVTHHRTTGPWGSFGHRPAPSTDPDPVSRYLRAADLVANGGRFAGQTERDGLIGAVEALLDAEWAAVKALVPHVIQAESERRATEVAVQQRRVLWWRAHQGALRSLDVALVLLALLLCAFGALRLRDVTVRVGPAGIEIDGRRLPWATLREIRVEPGRVRFLLRRGGDVRMRPVADRSAVRRLLVSAEAFRAALPYMGEALPGDVRRQLDALMSLDRA